jgi:acyl-CoA synthetase (NDP forming)
MIGDKTMGSTDITTKLDAMFFPGSIAIIGASDVPRKWGFMITTAITSGGYKGKIFPVNPKKEIILGLKAYPSLDVISEPVDLAIITIPASLVAQALRDCIRKGIHAVVLISSGFKETGEEGAQLEKEITEIARQGDLLFIGPNTMGIISTHGNLTSIGVPIFPKQGALGIISQSGNLGVQIIQWTIHRGMGVGFYAGTGNEAMLKASELLAYFGHRDEVKAIAMYLEGVDNGREFMDVARRVTQKKPVVALKTGKSKTGSKAAQSHSGAMAGSFATYSAMFKQCGIIQVRTPSELLNVSAALTNLPVPRSNRVGIMSLGGGWAVVTADECEGNGLVLPLLSEAIIDDLNKRLPPYWNRSNPIDLVGEGDPNLHLHTLEILARWDEVDSVIALGVIGRLSIVESFIESQEKINGQIFSRELKVTVLKDQMKTENRFINEMARLQRETGKPIVAVSLSEEGHTIVDTDYGTAMCLSTPEEAASIISSMAGYRYYLDHL